MGGGSRHPFPGIPDPLSDQYRQLMQQWGHQRPMAELQSMQHALNQEAAMMYGRQGMGAYGWPSTASAACSSMAGRHIPLRGDPAQMLGLANGAIYGMQPSNYTEAERTPVEIEPPQVAAEELEARAAEIEEALNAAAGMAEEVLASDEPAKTAVNLGIKEVKKRGWLARLLDFD